MANIKELLVSMIGKINGKLNAPEQAAQPYQQLVTDADGVAKWEDKLAYTEDCEIIHRQTVSCELKEGSLYGSTVDGHLTDEIVGKSLKVVFDGVEYECEAVKFSGVDGVCLGNTSLIGAQGGNGEPFIIFDQGNCVIGVSEPGEYEICILESHIKTIDPKYIPDIGNSISVVFMALNAEPDDHGWSCTEVTCNKSVDDIYAAFKSGTNIDALLAVESSFMYLQETIYNLRLSGKNDDGLIFTSLGCDISYSDAGDMYIQPNPVKVVYVVMGDSIAARCMHFSTNSGIE